MNPQQILRLEHIAITTLCVFAYHHLNGAWWLFALLFLAPDIAMLGYLFGNKIGATTYNLLHTQNLPIILFGVGMILLSPITTQLAIIWFAHISFDRAIGYGLKLPTGFHQTHLSAAGTKTI